MTAQTPSPKAITNRIASNKARRIREAANPPEAKVCRGCKAVKPFAEFSPSKEGRYGKRSRCKACVNGKIDKVKACARARKAQLVKYGITPGQYDSLRDAQGYRCAICQTMESAGGVKLHTDHDHVSGAVRGLLCFKCNSGMGNFKDNPQLLLAAIEFLNTTTILK